MFALMLTALAAAGVVTAVEYLYILFTCGPYWLGPGIFLSTWLVYSIGMLVGLVIFNWLLGLVPALKSTTAQIRRLSICFIIGWIVGSAGLIALVIKDFDEGAGFSGLIILSLVVGLISTVLFLLIAKRKANLILKPTATIIFLLVVVLVGHFSVDYTYGSDVKARTQSYRGIVPHLCLIVLDTTRGDHFSSYGYPFKTTPNMDRIAAEGLRCHLAFSASNWTPPGHISTFTGKYPSQHGNDGQPYTPEELITMTEVLREEGYYCVALYNNPLAGNNINLTQGFDSDLGVYRHSWVYPAWQRLIDKLIYHDSGSRRTFPLAAKIAEWVEGKGGHLFLYLNLVEPHADYIIHEPYFSEFTKSLDFTAIPNPGEVKGLCAYLEKIVYDSTFFARYDESSYRYLRAVYDSELAYMDEQFGVYDRMMRSNDLLDQTLLVITADHGEFLGEHFTRGHPDIMYNPVLRIPLMLRYPRSISSTVENRYTSNVDVLPTCFALMGYEPLIPDGVESINILGSDFPTDRKILSERVIFNGGSRSLINGSYKVILNSDEDFLAKFPYDTLLVNLEEDPEEQVDLHGKEPELTGYMATELTQWVDQIFVEPAEEIELSEEAKANLRALGYVR